MISLKKKLFFTITAIMMVLVVLTIFTIHILRQTNYYNDIYPENINAYDDNYINGNVYANNDLPYEDKSYEYTQETPTISFNETITMATNWIEHLMRTFSVPGVTIALVDAENDFTWVQGFGYANTLTNTPVDEHTLFPIGSISKTFTAIAVMQLVERGLICLDNSIVTYLPEFSILPNPLWGGDYQDITVRMLLAHASGLPNLSPAGSGWMTLGGHSFAPMDNLLENLSQLYMQCPAGTRLVYSNTNFDILGAIISTTVGAENFYDGFFAHTRTEMFEPIGMYLTTFLLDQTDSVIAQGYVDASLQDEFIYYNSFATGTMASSAYEMARFMHTILNGGIFEGERILYEETLLSMFEIQDFGFESDANMFNNGQFGLGFMRVTTLMGYELTGKFGGNIHHVSAMVFDKDSSIGIFISVNSVSGRALPADIAFSFLQNAVIEKTGVLDLPVQDEPIRTYISAEQLSVFEGFYFMPMANHVLRVALGDNGILYIHHLYDVSPEPLALTSLDDGSFLLEYLVGSTGLNFRVWFEEFGENMKLFFGLFQTQLLASRITPELLLLMYARDDFEQWVGVYYPKVAEGEISIVAHLNVNINKYNFAGLTSYLIRDAASNWSPLFHIDESRFDGNIEFGITNDGTAYIRINESYFIRR